MKYSSFNKKSNDATKEPMFFGEPVNVARYDIQKYNIFEKLIEKQLSFFWRPEEVDISNDKNDYNGKLEEHEKHIFTSNLKYQTLLDSIQGRSPNIAFLACVSIPELETWIETWAFSETIHSRSYTHIIRNLVSDPSVIFDDIVENEEIQKRAGSITDLYDDFIEYQGYYNLFGEGIHEIKTHGGEDKVVEISMRELKKKLYLALIAVNILEGVRFFVSFACSFAFAERELMEGNAKIIKLIARDEALHLTGTQYMLEYLKKSECEEFKSVIKECEPQVYELYKEAAEQEKDWGRYLFKDGSMIGLNSNIINEYVEYITDFRLKEIGLKTMFNRDSNPIPWINSWLQTENYQVAPQEAEISSYLVAQIDSAVPTDAFDDMEL